MDGSEAHRAITHYQARIREHRHALIYASTPITVADIQAFARTIERCEWALGLLGRASHAELTDPEPGPGWTIS